MKIYGAFIIKDDSELKTFKVMLDSVEKYLDGWYVVANGEKTAEIEAFCKLESGNFYKKEWNNDFSEQRNFIFSKVPKDADYILWLDADDILIGGENLRDVARLGLDTHKDMVFLEYWYGCTFDGEPSVETFRKVDITHFRERLIKPNTHTWKGRLHETPIPVYGYNAQVSKISYKDLPIAVMHTKTMDDALATMDRNKHILELQLEDERKNGQADPRTLLYLMKIYAELKESEYWQQCLVMGKEYLEKSGWDEERATCCDIMAICHNKLGNTDQAIKMLHDAIREYPFYPLLYIRLAMQYVNLKQYDQAKHWLDLSSHIETEKKSAGITHLQEMKILAAQVLLKIKFEHEKDYAGAAEAAKLLMEEQPCQENQEQLNYLLDATDFQNACNRTGELFEYLDNIGETKTIVKLLETLPIAITSQQFAIKWRQKVTPPRVWGDKEICYFANFMSPHFEKWDGRSIQTGIGGSETAVIELSKEWTKQGYKVTVYGDPEQPMIVDGVTYLPWYYFNRRDYFNIFIQWRMANLAGNIKCKKFMVDLHDIYNPSSIPVNAVDAVMVKSAYHLPDYNSMNHRDRDKFRIAGNGINV